MTIREFFKKLSAPILWGNFLAMALVAVALVAGILIALDRYTHHGEKVTVPDLRGLSESEARTKLQLLGLQSEVTDSGFVRSLPAGAVLGQSVKAGKDVKPGRTIFLTLNSGTQPTIALPDIADNSSLREAESRLTSIGFKLGPTEYIEGEKDWVYSVKAAGRIVSAGTRISVDTPIVLVVGNGQSSEDAYPLDSIDYSDDFLFDEGDMPLDEESGDAFHHTPAAGPHSTPTDDDHIPYAE